MISSPLITVDIRKIDDSGIGTYIKNLLPEVISMTPDFNYCLIVKQGKLDSLIAKYPWIDSENVSTIECASEPSSIQEQFELPKLIPKNSNLYWATHFNIPLFSSKKLLVTIYDIIHLAQPQLAGGSKSSLYLKRAYLKLMLANINARKAQILTISNFTKSEILTHCSIADDRINVTYLGISDDWFDVKKIDRPYEKPYLLFVGNVKPHKNLRNLLYGFKSIMHQIPHDLVIVGQREKMRTIDRDTIAEAESISERVKFTGYVSEELLKQYFAYASALVLPSFYEGFGIPPIEAFACGCPVLVSNVASLPEICQDAALYCDPFSVDDLADKIVKILTDDNLRSQLIDKGKLRAAEFSCYAVADKTVRVINDLLID
jgi:glycosyltransferase involved in cell wall biosynthesis